MVPRRVATGLAAAACLFAVALPASASADNRRIAIGDYQWSDEELELDRGEHVTWYWVGPDTVHSITGDSPDAAGIDSDPNRGQPEHDVGDRFRVDFNRPGSYSFRCKIHSTVRGTVTVSNKPGDPVSEPDPVPKPNVDLEPPALRELTLKKKKFGRRGTNLRYAVDERSRIQVDYYRYDSDGRRRYAGGGSFKAFVGYNGSIFGRRSKAFGAEPGRYLAKLRAVDEENNVSRDSKLTFRIRRR